MSLEEQKQLVESSGVFHEWSKSNKGNYFYMIFAMFEAKGCAVPEFSYYNPKIKKATVFGTENGVSIITEDKIFGGKIPKPLSLDNVKLEFGEALEAATKVQQEHYKAETPLKNIVILQVQDKKPIWNVTFLTYAFSTLNIKIDAHSGACKGHSMKKLFELVEGTAPKGK